MQFSWPEDTWWWVTGNSKKQGPVCAGTLSKQPAAWKLGVSPWPVGLSGNLTPLLPSAGGPHLGTGRGSWPCTSAFKRMIDVHFAGFSRRY